MKTFYKYGEEPEKWSFLKYGTDEYTFFYFTKYFFGIDAKFNQETRCIEVNTTVKEFKKLELQNRNTSSFNGIPVKWKIKNKKGGS